MEELVKKMAPSLKNDSIVNLQRIKLSGGLLVITLACFVEYP